MPLRTDELAAAGRARVIIPERLAIPLMLAGAHQRKTLGAYVRDLLEHHVRELQATAPATRPTSTRKGRP